MRRLFLCLAAMLSPGLTLATAGGPNIIVMVADDIGWADVGFHDGEIDTPPPDRLALGGVEL